MKKIATFFVLAAFLCGCTKEISNNQNTEDPILAKLVFSGDVSIYEEPLTKAGESNALLGIQVYQGTTPYAYGLFDTLEDIGLYLHSGAEYSVICQYIKNGKITLHNFNEAHDGQATYILSDSYPHRINVGTSSKPRYVTETYYREISQGPTVTYLNGVYYNYHRCSQGYGTPFDILDNYYPCYSSQWWCKDYYKRNSHYEPIGGISETHTICPITRSFNYDPVNIINVTESDVTKSPSSSASIDRFYGESGSFTASPGSGTIVLNMKHLVYGLQCNVTGISDGTASVTIKNGDNTLLEKTDISGEYHSEKMMFAFSDMHSAWQYSDDYSENVTVSLTWHRGVGITQDLGSVVIQVKRNCMNVINVSLSTTTKASAKIGVESEQSDMNIISIDSNTHF